MFCLCILVISFIIKRKKILQLVVGQTFFGFRFYAYFDFYDHCPLLLLLLFVVNKISYINNWTIETEIRITGIRSVFTNFIRF